MKRIKISDIAVVLILILSLANIDSVKEGIVTSVKSCVFTIVPSLFVTCVLSTIIVDTGMIERLVASKKTSSSIFSAFILGNIGGYPIGAKVLRNLVDQKRISSYDAENAICFCYASGPAFCLGIVSSVVFSSKVLGIISFISTFLANLSIYLFYVLKKKFKASAYCNNENFSFTDIVTSAVQSSSYAMLSICSAIVFFSALIAVASCYFPKITAIPAIKSILEISNIASFKYNGLVSFATISVLLSFGGLCVHMQVKSLVGSSFGLKKFYITRPIQLALTAAYSSLLYLITQSYLPALQTGEQTKIAVSQSDSIVPFVCVIFMIVISITYRKKHVVK